LPGPARTYGNYALTVKCWLNVGKGEVAAEFLARLEEIDSLRVAALLIRETGRVGGGVLKRTVSLDITVVKRTRRRSYAGSW
jgi:hypothetical protein